MQSELLSQEVLRAQSSQKDSCRRSLRQAALQETSYSDGQDSYTRANTRSSLACEVRTWGSPANDVAKDGLRHAVFRYSIMTCSLTNRISGRIGIYSAPGTLFSSANPVSDMRPSSGIFQRFLYLLIRAVSRTLGTVRTNPHADLKGYNCPVAQASATV